MKLSLQEYRRRTLIPVAGLALAAYYAFVYVPLRNRADQLDQPLQKAWAALAASLGQTNAVAVDFARLTNQLEVTRQSLAIVESARRKALDRLELSGEIQGRMSSRFQLVEYDYERGKALEGWARLSKERKVAVEPGVYLGFPEHTAEVRQPELLWAALPMINGLIISAINSQVEMLHSLETPVVLTNVPNLYARTTLDEVPIQLELTGPVANVTRFIQSLPLRPEEIAAAGLPETAPDKPPLYIDRLIIKKQSPGKPDEVRVWLRVLGFVLRR